MTYKRVYDDLPDLGTFVSFLEKRFRWQNSADLQRNQWELVRFYLPQSLAPESFVLEIPLTVGRVSPMLRLQLPTVLSIYTNSKGRTSWDPDLHTIYLWFRTYTKAIEGQRERETENNTEQYLARQQAKLI